MKTTDERAFETHVEEILRNGGWKSGTAAEWDSDRALFPPRILAYLQLTQPKLWGSGVFQARCPLGRDNLNPYIRWRHHCSVLQPDLRRNPVNFLVPAVA